MAQATNMFVEKLFYIICRLIFTSAVHIDPLLTLVDA